MSPFTALSDSHTRAGGIRNWSTPQAVDHQFIEMLEVFRPGGGMAPLPETMAWFKAHQGPTADTVHAWISQREVVCLHWQSQWWLPWFQFDRKTCSPHVQMRTVLRELNAVHAPWEACRWFTLPNPWLGQRRPLEALFSDLSGVLHAASADRLIANGSSVDGHPP
jgi:hypothetical protein